DRAANERIDREDDTGRHVLRPSVERVRESRRRSGKPKGGSEAGSGRCEGSAGKAGTSEAGSGGGFAPVSNRQGRRTSGGGLEERRREGDGRGETGWSNLAPLARRRRGGRSDADRASGPPHPEAGRFRRGPGGLGRRHRRSESQGLGDRGSPEAGPVRFEE